MKREEVEELYFYLAASHPSANTATRLPEDRRFCFLAAVRDLTRNRKEGRDAEEEAGQEDQERRARGGVDDVGDANRPAKRTRRVVVTDSDDSAEVEAAGQRVHHKPVTVGEVNVDGNEEEAAAGNTTLLERR
jgi:hypothetical protein